MGQRKWIKGAYASDQKADAGLRPFYTHAMLKRPLTKTNPYLLDPAKRRAMFQMTVYFQRLPHALLPRVAAGVSRRRCYEALRRRETTVALGEAAHMVRLGSKDEAAWCF